MKRLRLLITAFIVLVAFGTALYTQRVRISDLAREWNQPPVPEAVTYDEVVEEETEEVAEETEGQTDKETEAEEEILPEPVEDRDEETEALVADIPIEFNLAVPFTPQAPFANWDETHEEACEEASVYMVHLYYEGEPEGLVEPQTAEDGILKLVEFQKTLFGFFEDTTAEQTAIFAEQFYGYTHIELIHDPTAEQIKEHVAAGRPVIVPAAGQLLGNPYFTAPGPVYHMLVVRGYTQDQFITNDPGTRRGEEYVYDIDTVMNAMHDWNPEQITAGAKVVVVIYPE